MLQKSSGRSILLLKNTLMIINSPVGMPGRAIKGEFLKRVADGLEVPKNCPVDCIKTCKLF